MNITFDDVITLVGNGYEVYEDAKLKTENQRILSGWDSLLIAKQLGTTEERFSKQIGVHDTILSIKYALEREKEQQFNQQHPFQQHTYFQPTYSPQPIYDPAMTYRTDLQFRTRNIFWYMALKYSQNGLEWVLSKYGNEVKNLYQQKQGTPWR